MTDIYKLFEKEIWTPDDCTAYVWTRACDDEMSYNKKGRVDDLMNGDGATYSYSIQFEVERDGFVMFALQEYYGGQAFQAIFDLSKKVDEDKYWEDVENEDEEE
jgi:hypothetical protein